MSKDHLLYRFKGSEGKKQSSTGMERRSRGREREEVDSASLAAIIWAETNSKIPTFLFSESHNKSIQKGSAQKMRTREPIKFHSLYY
jgi:hypothetical protein